MCDFDAVSAFYFHYQDDNREIQGLSAKASALASQLAVLEQVAPVAASIRIGGSLSTIRRLRANIAKLSKSGHRWASLQQLGCREALFCMISIRDLTELPKAQFDWLLANVQRYMAGQGLPQNWPTLKQISEAIGRMPWQPQYSSFLQSYFELVQNQCSSETQSTEDFPVNNKREISGTMGYDPDQDINNAEPLNITSNLPSNRKRGRTKKRLIFTSTDREKEVKFMFSNAPFEIVDTLPDKLKEAVQASSLWREERNQRRSTTGCLASLFPRDAEQDVSFTIWCGHDQGYDLNNFFQLKRTSDP